MRQPPVATAVPTGSPAEHREPAPGAAAEQRWHSVPMHDDLRRITIVRLHVAAYRYAADGANPRWAATAVRAISTDPHLLATATAPYTKDTATRIERRAANILARAGANLIEARRIWQQRTTGQGFGMSGLGGQPGQ